jgi:hypothetical protein
MDLYKTNKYQSKYENIIYVSKLLYTLINRPIEIDTLFNKFAKKTGETINSEYEHTLMLSLCFMFSIGMIEITNEKIRRCNNDF